MRRGLKRIMKSCQPDMIAASVVEVDLEALRARGIDALFLDLDNTLVLWRSQEVREDVAEWIRRARDTGFRLCIVSNAATVKRVRPVAGILGLPFFVRAGKPRSRGFRRAAALLDVPAERSAVIGDQVFTDVLGGHRAGMLAVLVSPMDRRREFISTRCMRLLERIFHRYTHGHLKEAISD